MMDWRWMGAPLRGLFVLALLTQAAAATPDEPSIEPEPAEAPRPAVAPVKAKAPVAQSRSDRPPREAVRLVGRDRRYRPLIRHRFGGIELGVPAALYGTLYSFGEVPVDPRGGVFSPTAALDTQVRVGAYVDSRDALSPIFFRLEYEHDIYAGVADGGMSDLDAVDPPFSGGTDHQLRKAYARVSVGPIVTLAGGFMTSHWGLGLLANDGAHGWSPGSAYFGDPRYGDRVLRGLVASGPWTNADLVVSAALDSVRDDDIMNAPGDEARQIIVAAVLGHEKPRQIGAYGVARRQDSADRKRTDVAVADVYGKWTGNLSERWTYTTELEAAYIHGTTELAPTADREVHDVRQLAVMTRITAQTDRYGGVLDFLYASGDGNFDDATQSGFRVDPNLEMGLLLFRHVMAAQTARAPITASDPDLVGYPSEDLDRFPTRGSVTNTFSFFPRAWYRFTDGFEIYGGPLFAFSAVGMADPRNARLAGGDPRNALDGEPGRYLGTELDVGVRYRALLGGTLLEMGLEGGVFQPGSAFTDEDGRRMSAVGGGRAILRYRL